MLALIGVVYAVNRPDLPAGPGPVVESPPPTLPTSTSHSPTATPTHQRASQRPSPTPRPASTAEQIPVTVLNNSTVSGLAATAADQLRGRHWPIRLVGNFTGRIAISTAYYEPGQKQSALRLAKEFPAVRRVLPRFDGLPGRGLTLVVTREWPA